MMTYKIKTLFSLLLSLLVLMSCEEVIDVDLKSSDPVLVIEGRIYQGEPAYVMLSKTTNYFSTDTSEYISDAVVTLTDDKGGTEVLAYVGQGLYQGQTLLGESGNTYSLSVDKDNEKYSGKATLFAPVEIYDVIFSESRFFPRSDEFGVAYEFDVIFSDDTLVDNFYMLEFFNNDAQVRESYFLISDEFSSNDTITTNSRQYTLFEGSYEVKVYSLDEDTYDFYNQMNDLEGSGSTPYNPESNFGSDVMGYFTAFSFATDSGTVELPL